MLTIYGRATSSNVQKVMWTVGELGLAHERLDFGGAFGGLDTPDYLAMNPWGLIPVVKFDDGRTMFESNAIVRHLARQDPERRLWPEAREAEADMWAEWAHNAVMRPVIALFWAYVRTLPEQRDEGAIAGHLSEIARALKVADAALEGQSYMVGETLTIADIQLGHVLYRYFTMPVEHADVPNVAAYYTRLTERQAYATHAMVDYSSLWATA